MNQSTRLAFVLVPLAAAAVLAAGCEKHETVTVKETTVVSEKGVPAPTGLVKTAPSKDYPLKTCVVSGDPLTAMGEPVAYTYRGTEVQFCCPSCIEKFEKDPATYLAKIAAAKK